MFDYLNFYTIFQLRVSFIFYIFGTAFFEKAVEKAVEIKMSTIIIMRVTPSTSDSTCVICFEIYTKESSIQFHCLHETCIACYEKLLNQHTTIHCPLCREIVDVVVQTEQQIESPHTSYDYSYNWCSLYFRELVCYALLLGGISAFFVIK